MKTVKTVFRLIHVGTGCALYGGTNTLPKWYDSDSEADCIHATGGFATVVHSPVGLGVQEEGSSEASSTIWSCYMKI